MFVFCVLLIVELNTPPQKKTKKTKKNIGADAFLLWDSYGFPLDLTQLMAEEGGLKVDDAAFETALADARARSKASGSSLAAPRSLLSTPLAPHPAKRSRLSSAEGAADGHLIAPRSCSQPIVIPMPATAVAASAAAESTMGRSAAESPSSALYSWLNKIGQLAQSMLSPAGEEDAIFAF